MLFRSSEHILDGYSYSQPFMCQRNNELADLFYFFSCGKDNIVYVLGYIAISPFGKKTIDYQFANEPFDKFTLNTDIEQSKIKQYEEVYAAVHSFAFSQTVNEDEKKTLRNYLELLPQVMSQSQLEFYSRVIPEFFSWVQKAIKGN